MLKNFSRALSWAGSAAAGVLLMLSAEIVSAAPTPLNDAVVRQIEDLQAEKASRTRGEQKMDSHLVLAAKRRRKVAFPARLKPMLEKTIKVEADGAAAVDISAPVTEDLLAALKEA